MRRTFQRSQISRAFRFAVGFGAVAISVQSAHAGGRTSISLTANPSVIIADGKSTTTISIAVRGGSGELVPDGTEVHLAVSQGILDKETVTTVSGVARAVLTSSSSEATATVTATCVLSGDAGAGNANLPVEFTSDRTLASTSGESRWARIDCPEYLIYSADGKIVEADGKHGSAHLRYHGITMEADALQLDLQTMQLLAHNAVLKQGKHTLNAAQLKYDLNANNGKAVLQGDATRGPHEVTVTGLTFETKDMAAQPDGMTLVDKTLDDPNQAQDDYRFLDLSQSRVVITARALAVDNGNQVQFRRATIYSDGKKVLSAPFHVMPLNTDQLFGEQIVGFGTQGLFLNVPYYYSVSPTSTGTIYLRNSAIAGASLDSNMPVYGSLSGESRPGVSLDLQQTYSLGAGGQGSLIMNSLTRSDWGAHWNHTQQIDSATNSNFYVDFPSHRSLFGASNVTHHFKDFSLNFNASANNDPGQDGYSSSGTSLNTYLQTNAREIGSSGINFVSSATVQSGKSSYTIANGAKTTQNLDTEGLDTRFFTAPVHLGKETTLTNSLTVGNTWSRSTSTSAPTVLGTLGLNRPMPMKGRLNVNYTYRYDPLLSHYSDSTLAGLYNQAASQHRMNVSYSALPSKKVTMSLMTNIGWPQNTTNFFSNVEYKYSDDWQLGLSTFYSKYFLSDYSACELSLTRRIFGRSLIFTYSTDTHKVRFDFGAGSF